MKRRSSEPKKRQPSELFTQRQRRLILIFFFPTPYLDVALLRTSPSCKILTGSRRANLSPSTAGSCLGLLLGFGLFLFAFLLLLKFLVVLTLEVRLLLIGPGHRFEKAL